MPDAAPPERGRLLRVLLVRLGEVPIDPGARTLLQLIRKEAYTLFMLRRLAIFFVLIAILISQVSVNVSYACRMMGSEPAALKHCCCDPNTAAPGNDEAANHKGCCHAVVEIAMGPGDQSGLLSSVKVPSVDLQPLPALLIPVLLSLAFPPQVALLAWNEAGDHSLYGTDLYLRTQRLRL